LLVEVETVRHIVRLSVTIVQWSESEKGFAEFEQADV